MPSAAVIIEETGARTGAAVLASTLARAGLWKMLEARCRACGVARDELRILIKPDLGGFAPGSPAITLPGLVEDLLDLLFAEGYARACVCAAPDASGVWLDNRSPDVAADLLGYKYRTPAGADYDVVNLAENADADAFAPDCVLHGHPLSRDWREAHVRIVFAKNKTCQRNGFALCLQSLLDVFAAPDKAYQYGARIGSGEAVAALLRAVPVDFALIDAFDSAHGSGGAQAPNRLDTGVLIASPDPLLCDLAGAAKMGLDPMTSPVVKAVAASRGIPSGYRVQGSLAPYPGWRNVDPVLRDSVQARSAWVDAERTLAPWMQSLDPELFPFKNMIDERVNRALAPALGRLDEEPGTLRAAAFSNYLLAWLHQALFVYRIHFDKDSLRRLELPLNIAAASLSNRDFADVKASALQWLPLVQGGPNTGDCGLVWRYLDGAVIFEVAQSVPVAFDDFVAAFDVARAIEFMNDYIGGNRHVVKRDARGRATRQLERNLYLPQPNYVAIHGGAVIDVTKIETIEYAPGAHRMWWKTVLSANGSARYDDGVVTIARAAGSGDTVLRIAARQHFTLPPALEAWRLDLAPTLKNQLVTQAYETFARRTFANFVAVTEGRDPRIGRDWAAPDDIEERPVEALTRQVDRARAGEGPFAWVAKALGGPAAAAGPGADIDADGFAHFAGPAMPGAVAPAPQRSEIGVVLRELAAALAKDIRL